MLACFLLLFSPTIPQMSSCNDALSAGGSSVTTARCILKGNANCLLKSLSPRLSHKMVASTQAKSSLLRFSQLLLRVVPHKAVAEVSKIGNL